MGYLFFDILSEIAYYKDYNQATAIHLRIQLIFNAFQYLALLFPNNGWKIWKYNGDSAFSFFQQLLSYFLILPITQDQPEIWGIIIVLIFAIQISVFLTVTIFIISKKLFPQTQLTKGIFYTLLGLVNFYFLNMTLSLSIPITLFYISGLSCNDSITSFSKNNCTQQASFYLSILGIVLTLISQLLTIYFFRSYTFQPFSLLQSKYSTNSFIIIALKPIALFLYQLETSYDDLFFIAYNFLMLSLMIDSYYVNSYYPPHNELNFKLLFTIFSISIFVTLNVMSKNVMAEQTLILVYIMLIAVAGFSISIIILRRKLYHQSHPQLFPQCKTIDLVQRISQTSQDLLRSKSQLVFFHFFFLIRNHSWMSQEKINFQTLQVKKIILQILQNQLKYSKNHGKISFEQVQLVYIDFLANNCKKSLVSLVEFKRYDIFNQQHHSFYFQQMKSFINDDIQQLVQQKQQNNQIPFIREQEKQSLDINHISKSIIFEDQFIPGIIKLIDQKIKFWEQLIKGYESIYQFQEVAINLSIKVQILQQQLVPNLSFDIQNIDHLNTNCNVLELKIASIFYSAVMNDYYSSAQCEYLISEIFNIEHALSQNIITNLTLIEDKVILIMISLIKNLGQITNKDKRGIASYFGYDDAGFQSVEMINQLMPPFLAVIHDNLLKDYLQKAKSKLFHSYNLVFSLNQQGFLVPQQLKIDNNFNINDDYVIMGCLSQIKKGVDFLLFGEDGKILGCTENFFCNYVLVNNQKLPLQKFINSFYIYMLIPQLFQIIDSYRKKLNDFINEIFIIEETAQMIISHNIQEIITQFTLSYKEFATIPQNKASEDSKFGLTKRKMSISINERERLDDDSSQDDSSKKHKNEFLNREIQQQIGSILTTINVLIQKQQQFSTIEKYLIRFSLSYKSIGKENYRRQYFIIEFHDIRKRDLIGQSISTNNQIHQYDPKIQSILNNMDQTQDNQSDEPGFTQTDQPSSEIVPQVKDIGCGVAEGIKRMGRSRKNKLDSDNAGLYNLDSGRDSLSYGPLSQRAYFINPNQQNEHLFEKIDQEFNEMDLQLNSVSAIIQQQNKEQFEAIGEFEIEESGKQQNEFGKSSSLKDKHNQIIKIIQKNQMKGKTHECEEVQALKSKSSITSGTSGNQAIQLIKSFQSLTRLTTGLKIIAYLSAVMLLILITLIVVNVVIIYFEHIDTEDNINNIQAPLILSRNYLEITVFSWSIILDTLGIVTFSDFMKKQQMQDLTKMTISLNNVIYNLYSGFVQVEELGLLSHQKYTFLNGDQEEMLFPYFINLIELNLNRVSEITTISNLSQVLNQSYLNELFLLRFNLNQLQSTTSELIDSLNEIFINQTLQKATEMQIQVIVEIVCIAICLSFEVYFWRQVINYCQFLLLLISRLQESDANELIARATLVKESLVQQSGQNSWKKQNYYALNYQQRNQLNLDLQNTQSKIVKDFLQKISQDIKQQNNTKRNLNVILSSRIQKTQLNFSPYILMISSIFVILAFIFFGGFLLFQQQTNDLGPSQTLLANYLKFSSKMDTMVTCSLIAKTQPLLYDQLISQRIYDNKTIDSFSQTMDVVILFTDLNENYSENLTDIYNDVLISTKISQQVKTQLYQLYANNFCLSLSDVIPMCNIDTLGLSDFSALYGNPDLELDDNREFISKGVVGVESHLDVLYQLEFYYEQDNLQFQPDLELSQRQANQKEFRSGIFDHFLDSNDGTNQFFDLIYTSTVDILNENLVYMLLYYGILGFAIVICYAIFYITFIIHTNNKLIRIRLALITLPISIITDQHTISMLKKLS